MSVTYPSCNVTRADASPAPTTIVTATVLTTMAVHNALRTFISRPLLACPRRLASPGTLCQKWLSCPLAGSDQRISRS